MRSLPFLLLLVACTTPEGRVSTHGAPEPELAPRTEVHFSPHGGCSDAIVQHIAAAKKTIYVQAYDFTSQPIADALVAAQARHVRVQVILDRANTTQKSDLAEFVAAGIPTLIDAKHAIAHNKVMVFDGRIVETGSYNYTNAAENSNAENCLFISDANLAMTYYDNWKTHQAHSVVPSP